MSLIEFTQLETDLNQALSSYDWSEAEKLCVHLCTKIYESADIFPESNSKRLLNCLRKKRRLELMTNLAETILRSDQTNPQIQRQYAQALIDRNILYPAEVLLKTIINEPSTNKAEEVEARGLTGRVYKQLYVNSVGGDKTKRKVFFERALKEYLYCYRLDVANFWHGINVVALVKRGRRDGISLQGLPDTDAMAEEILNDLKQKQEASADALPAFCQATILEAQIALGRNEDAVSSALDYSLALDADSFEFNSTIRQLTEVWQLSDTASPGSEILPILRSALLRSEGGEINLSGNESAREVEKIKGLEAVFGVDKSQTLKWYRMGLERSDSVARVELLNGRGHGTAWLVKRSDFFDDAEGFLLVTNAHVVSTNSSDIGLPPNQLQANFQGMNRTFELDEIIWSSPQNELDATFVSVKGEPPPVEPLPIDLVPIRMGDPPPRFYIIGHPGGRDLEFSIHDNHLVAANETILHYRTPTEGGSSGSPVFNQFGWKVVALHHKGLAAMQRIDGKPGTYEANEGITLKAIKNAIKNGGGG